tara:strand:+ start:147 stop:491 length:345 start_codon:yes stop_codon:yes gene_type:complete
VIRDEFIREAKVLRVVDGDTYDLMVSLGFGSYISIRVRLAGADTWEMRGENKEAGRLAKEHVKGLTRATAGRVLLRSTEYKKGKYGRTIGDVTSVSDGTDWGDSLKENGHVKRT